MYITVSWTNTEPDGAHIADHVRTLRVERAADLAHPLGGLDERHGERPLHVRGVVASAAAELQHLADRTARRAADHVDVERRFLGVFGRRRDDRPPIRKAVVELLRHEQPPM
jgi:hypothetical protein